MFRSTLDAVIGEWLTASNIAFSYEAFSFQVDTKTHTPDFYLSDHGLFFEGKGVWSVGGRAKFRRFRELYPNISILIIPYLPSLIQQMKRETRELLRRDQ